MVKAVMRIRFDECSIQGGKATLIFKQEVAEITDR